MKRLCLLFVLVLMLFASSCTSEKIELSINEDVSRTVSVGESVDYGKFFKLVVDGKQLVITNDMLDTTNVDINTPGSYKVIVKYGDSQKEITITVVSSDDLISISLAGAKDLVVGESTVLSVVKEPSSNTSKTTFSSSNEAVATVDENGKVTALKEGTVTITAICQGKEAAVTINVSEASTELESISITNEKDLVVGEVYKLIVSKTPANNQDTVEFSSSDEGVVAIDNEGNIEGIKVGTAIITVTCNGIVDTTTINVTAFEMTDYEAAFNKLINYESWNMIVTYTQTIEGYTDYEYLDVYQYDGENFKNTYEGADGQTYNDYVISENNILYYYCDNGDGSYSVFDEDTDTFYDYYLYYLYMNFSNIKNYQYTYKDGLLYANNPQQANDDILGAYDDSPVFKSFTFKIENDYVTEIKCTYEFVEEGETYIYVDKIVFSDFGTNSIDVAELKSKVEIEETPEATDIAVFKDTNFTSDGKTQYSANKQANNFDTIRGVQFLQENGTVTITSKAETTNIKSITVVVATNQDAGMKVKVSVGGVNLLINGQDTANVPKTNFDVNTTLTFSSENTLSGYIVIELIPNASKKSMYISSIALSDEGKAVEPTEVMPKQQYSSTTFSNKRLQDYMMDIDGAIGLSSTGEYNCLVIPVEFSDGSITALELDMLSKAFNGTSVDTGWESVNSFYKKSSYDQLNMNFDILDVYTASNQASHYENYSKNINWGNGLTTTQYGDTALLLEVLAYLEPLIDLTKYDNDKDNVIDGVYLIYDYPIQYEGDNDFFWAYVSWYTEPDNSFKTFDGLDPYYYLFAGIDFMIEDVEGGFEYNGYIDGLLINAATYIHETGHMLSLDDYYDYYDREGADDGVGGADMMDSTIGDHCSYSKIMLDWITPNIVNETKTITIKPFEENGDTIMILLDSNDSYMSEYLLIDLYTTTNLNSLHASLGYLYGDSQYGVRIYHVSSEVDEPYADDYGSFTKYNNSLTDISLIKLIQADGETDFDTSDGYVESSDLWQASETLSSVFPYYARNDGKLVNFDISIDSVSATEATITITFKN